MEKSSEQGAERQTDQGTLTEVGIDPPSKGDTARNGADIEEAGSKGRDGEAVRSIQHSHHQGGQRDHQDEGIHNPRQLDRQGGLLGWETGCEKTDELSGKDHPEQRDQTHKDRGQCRHLGGELPCGVLPLGGDPLGEHGNEGCRKSSLGKKIS